MGKRRKAVKKDSKAVLEAKERIVWSTDLIDPFVELSREDVIHVSTPRNHFVPTPQEDFTNLPKTHRYTNFIDYNKKYRKNAELVPEEPLGEIELEA